MLHFVLFANQPPCTPEWWEFAIVLGSLALLPVLQAIRKRRGFWWF